MTLSIRFASPPLGMIPGSFIVNLCALLTAASANTDDGMEEPAVLR
jgi:hypothetical protein